MNDPTLDVVRNLVTLRRLSNGVEREMRIRVRAIIDEIVAEVARIDPGGPTRARYRKARIAKLMAAVNDLSAVEYPAMRRALESAVAGIGAQQAKWAGDMLGAAVGAVNVSPSAGVGVRFFRSILKADPFHGDTLAAWTERNRVSTVNNVRQQIQLGMAQSEDLPSIIRRIRGRSVGGGRYAGGVLRTSTKQAEGIARTAITYIANRAHMEAYTANSDILAGVEFTATLDSRTTPLCARWDGTVWAVDDETKQVPPLHYNCRSVLTPVVDWKGLGVEPPAGGTRASMGGQVPSSTTYEEWFRGQPPSVQNDVIGRSRAQLFRDDKLSFRDMIGRDNRVLTLEELGA